MLKRYMAKMTVAAVFLLLFSSRFVDVTIGEKLHDYPLESAWKATGIPLGAVDTAVWMKLNDRWFSVRQLTAKAKELQNALKLKNCSELISGEQAEFTFASLQGTRSDGTVVTITLQSSSSVEANETQLGINTSYSVGACGAISDLNRYLETLRADLGKLGSKPHFHIELSGERPGKLQPLLIKELSGRAFRRIEARVVEATAYENDASIERGYSPLLKDAVTYNFQQINIEFGTRFDPVRNITEIVMATPNLTDGT